VPIQPGWQIIAYLRDNPQNTASVFSALQDQITIVKDNQGKNYIPQYNINTIGDMKPGQGYKVQAISTGVLTYGSNFTADTDRRLSTPAAAQLQHFQIDSNFNTGNNATLVFPNSLVHKILESGDEVGVFNGANKLCGASMYAGADFSITVWGDDPSTPGIREGMAPNEPYAFRIWKMSSQREHSAAIQFVKGAGFYAIDNIDIAKSIALISATDEPDNITRLALYPNPATDQITMSIQSNESLHGLLQIIRLDGSYIGSTMHVEVQKGKSSVDLELPRQLPAGTYMIRLATENGVLFRPFVKIMQK
jgi:Secretion system C-terminal sorting domain